MRRKIGKGAWTAAALALTLAVILPGSAWAGKKRVPESLPGATVVDAERAKALMEQKKILVVDARLESAYEEEHLPGAVNIPEPLMIVMREELPSDKNHPVLFYSRGSSCWRSYKASRRAVQWGYTQVYWFRGGIPEWKAKGYPTE